MWTGIPKGSLNPEETNLMETSYLGLSVLVVLGFTLR
ncbi:hypothetical protein LEMLEM_LOCUS23400, partial [Lemmus lemmus]